jgi:hypothetical protein
MPLGTRSIRFVISLMLTAVLAVSAFADTVRLKDGSIIKGKITSFDSGKFVVVIGEGSRRREMAFMASEIESIQFDPPSMNPQNTSPSPRPASYKDPVKTTPTVKVVTTDTTGPQTRPENSGGKLNPIGWTVKVLADNTSNGWTNSGWVVKKGQRIRISGDGKISLGKGKTTTPAGDYALDDNQKLLKNVATGALLAVIGDDNNDFIYVGSEREFVATRDGALFLGINEGNLDDNSGSFNVKIEIIPDDGN